MPGKYKILHLEDVASDAELIARELSAHNISFDHFVVDSEIEYIKALKDLSPDIILSDHSMPNFNSFEAFRILKEHKLNIPFIIITATLTEEVAMNMVRKGVDDYILKDRIKRLPHAVINAVEKFRFEKDRKKFIDQVYQDEAVSKELLSQLSGKVLLATKAGGIGIWEYIFNENKFVADDIMLQQYGLSQKKFNDNYESLIQFVHADDKQKVIETFMHAFHQHTEVDVEFRIVWEDATIHFIKAAAVIQYNTSGTPDRILGTHQDITIAKIAEHKLTESENRFRAIIEKSTELVTLTTEEGKILYISPSVTKTFGYTFKDIGSKILFSLFHPDDLKEFEIIRKKVLKNYGSLVDYQIRVLDKNGSWIWCECTLTNMLEEPGVHALVKSFRNISERKSVEKEQIFNKYNLEALINNTNDMMWSVDRDYMLITSNQSFVQKVSDTLGGEIGKGMSVLSDSYPPEMRTRFKESYDRAFSGESFTEIEEFDIPVKFWSEISYYPIRNGEEVIGTACHSRDITQRKNAEIEQAATYRQLQLALKELNNIMSSSLDIICTINRQGEFVTASAASTTIWGYTPQELKGIKFINLIHPDDVQRTAEVADEIIQGTSVSMFENSYIRKDGSIVPMLWSATWDEKDELMYCIAKDATEKKRLEKAFEYEKQRFAEMFSTAPASLGILKGPDHIFEMVNHNYLKLIGRENIIGKPAREVFPELVNEGLLELVDSVYKTGESVIIKEMLVPLSYNGIENPRYLDFMYQAYKDFEGSIEGIFFFVIDITEQVLSRKIVEESEMRYRTLFEQNLAGFYQSTIDGIIFNCNEAFAKMLKYDSAQDLLHTNASELYFSSQDRTDFIDSLMGERKLYNYEGVLKCKDGSAMYFLENISVHTDLVTGEELFDGILIDITERKLAELQITESHAKYKAIIDNSMSAFLLTDSDGNILEVNATTCQTLGYTNEELLKLNRKHILEVDSTDYQEAVEERKKTGVAAGEVYGIRKNGERFPISFTTSVFYTATGEQRLSSIGVDITEKKKAEEKLLKSNERFINVSKATFDAIWDWEVHNNDLYLGDGFKELFGHESLNGRTTFSSWSDHIHPEDKERVMNGRLNKIINHEQSNWRDEYRYLRADGSLSYVSDRGILLRNNQGTYRMIGAMQDVTDLKEKEIDIINLNKSLEKRAEELAVSNEELERFAYVTSHDLQEPLRMVTSFLQLLQKKYDNQLDETAQKYINFAVDGADRMKTLILDLLEFSRISSVKQVHTVINLNDVINKTRQILKTSIDETGAHIKVHFLPKVCGNETQLLQLFQNLISNGIKYRGKEKPVMEIGYTDHPKEWEFFIKDNGIGIEKKFFEKIFIIFQRLHNRNQYTGTGIGLAICKKIVELHGGKIWVESTKDNGATFFFTIKKVQTINEINSRAICPELIISPK